MTLVIDRPSPTQVRLRRRFAAPPERVFEAHVRPDLVRRWMCGEGGTLLAVCEIDARPGGALRYEWREPDGSGFSVSGHIEAIDPPRRIVHVEVMRDPDPRPETRIETLFLDDGVGGTDLEMTMTFPDEAAAAAAAASGMGQAMDGCYRLLEGLDAPAAR